MFIAVVSMCSLFVSQKRYSITFCPAYVSLLLQQPERRRQFVEIRNDQSFTVTDVDVITLFEHLSSCTEVILAEVPVTDEVCVVGL